MTSFTCFHHFPTSRREAAKETAQRSIRLWLTAPDQQKMPPQKIQKGKLPAIWDHCCIRLAAFQIWNLDSDVGLSGEIPATSFTSQFPEWKQEGKSRK